MLVTFLTPSDVQSGEKKIIIAIMYNVPNFIKIGQSSAINK